MIDTHCELARSILMRTDVGDLDAVNLLAKAIADAEERGRIAGIREAANLGEKSQLIHRLDILALLMGD